VAWVAGGVAATALAGYLVAAVLLFPAPLLPNERRVPRVTGAAVDDAQRTLVAAGFRAEIADREFHPAYPVGVVVWQDPAPDVAAPRGSAVALTVSEGPARRRVPDVHGLDADLAQKVLLSAGVAVSATDTVRSPLPAGVAAGTSPAAGDSVASGGAVTLHVARGPK
jgi:eukaryotic-like serine/threonine-protein kinase